MLSPRHLANSCYSCLSGARTSASNANSRILGYRQSLSKIDKPFLTMLDKLSLDFFCSCLQFSVLTRFVCRICLHFGPVFGGFFCRQSLSAGFVCILANFRRIFCRQSLSAELSVRVSCADKLCLQKLQTKFVCRTC